MAIFGMYTGILKFVYLIFFNVFILISVSVPFRNQWQTSSNVACPNVACPNGHLFIIEEFIIINLFIYYLFIYLKCVHTLAIMSTLAT